MGNQYPLFMFSFQTRLVTPASTHTTGNSPLKGTAAHLISEKLVERDLKSNFRKRVSTKIFIVPVFSIKALQTMTRESRDYPNG